MNDFDNEKRGVLFRNNDKQSDRSPDYSGRITVEGVEYQLAGWLTESAKGLKYLSIKARIPEEMPQSEPVRNSQPEATDDGEIPF